jgi:hypothetical protein
MKTITGNLLRTNPKSFINNIVQARPTELRHGRTASVIAPIVFFENLVRVLDWERPQQAENYNSLLSQARRQTIDFDQLTENPKTLMDCIGNQPVSLVTKTADSKTMLRNCSALSCMLPRKDFDRLRTIVKSIPERDKTNWKAELQRQILTETAYYEASHAVALFLQNLPFEYVTIKPNAGSLIDFGKRDFQNLFNEQMTLHMRSRLEKHIIAYLAGGLGGRYYTDNINDNERRHDLTVVKGWASQMVSEPELEAYLHWLTVRTEGLLITDQNWFMVETVAETLLVHERLSYRQVSQLIRNDKRERDAWSNIS